MDCEVSFAELLSPSQATSLRVAVVGQPENSFNSPAWLADQILKYKHNSLLREKLHFGAESNLLQCEQLSIEVTKMLNSWINTLKAKQTNH